MAGEDRTGDILRALGGLEGSVAAINKNLTEHRQEHREDLTKLHERINGQRGRIDALEQSHIEIKGRNRSRDRIQGAGLTAMGAVISAAALALAKKIGLIG